jgi:hypothetical protein
VLARGDDDSVGRGSPSSDIKVRLDQSSEFGVSISPCSSGWQIIYEPQLQLLLLDDWTIEEAFLNSPFTGVQRQGISNTLPLPPSPPSPLPPPPPLKRSTASRLKSWTKEGQESLHV